jgi:16S rRNA A1518/A1519 N6-dimethyltransferase RsmA/KsgA/DIM1 with predicted DNA glycosylase/AP lyase activity
MKDLYQIATLYDQQYLYYRDDLAFYVDLANNYGSPILELGTGTARVSVALAKAGYSVTGIELNFTFTSEGKVSLIARAGGRKAFTHTIKLFLKQA